MHDALKRETGLQRAWEVILWLIKKSLNRNQMYIPAVTAVKFLAVNKVPFKEIMQWGGRWCITSGNVEFIHSEMLKILLMLKALFYTLLNACLTTFKIIIALMSDMVQKSVAHGTQSKLHRRLNRVIFVPYFLDITNLITKCLQDRILSSAQLC